MVDDETLVRRFAVRVLEEEGFRVSEAADGAEALRLLQKEAPDVDAVVSDIVMPRLNGVELLQILSSTRPQLPVLLMSGYASGELEAWASPPHARSCPSRSLGSVWSKSCGAACAAPACDED